MKHRKLEIILVTALLVPLLNACGGSTESSSPFTTSGGSTVQLALSVSSKTITQNQSVTLHWDTVDALSCAASGDWSGSKPIAGSETITNLQQDSVFSLVCSGNSENVSQSVSVQVATMVEGNALLSWSPPTGNTDGSALSDLAGYRIYYGTQSGSYSNSVAVDPGLSSYMVENLTQGQWFFAMTAFDSNSVESAYSNEGSKMIN